MTTMKHICLSQQTPLTLGQGCSKFSLLSPRGTSRERTEERGNQQERASSPQPSPPSDGGEGEELDPALTLGADDPRILNRREFLWRFGGGLGGIALTHLLATEGLLAAPMGNGALKG